MRPKFVTFFLVGGLLAALALFLGGGTTRAQAADLTFTGKIVCSLKRAVLLPFPGEIVSLEVKPGQEVQAGEVLGRYRLLPEAQLALQRRVSPPHLQELTAKLAEAEKGVATLKSKEKGVRELARQNLAAPSSVAQLDRELKAANRQQAALRERLDQERRLLRDDRAILAKQFGGPVKPGQVPREGVLRAPINGRLVWMHPEMRVGAEMKGGEPVLMVGIMDPMLLKTRVHEIEATQLQEGESAEVTLESLPGRKFQAQVSRLPWAPPVLVIEQPTYYEVEFQVANPDLILKEGLKATLTVSRPGKPKP